MESKDEIERAAELAELERIRADEAFKSLKSDLETTYYNLEALQMRYKHLTGRRWVPQLRVGRVVK